MRKKSFNRKRNCAERSADPAGTHLRLAQAPAGSSSRGPRLGAPGDVAEVYRKKRNTPSPSVLGKGAGWSTIVFGEANAGVLGCALAATVSLAMRCSSPGLRAVCVA